MTDLPVSSNRVLALDLGQARIGVAVSDSLGWTAQPVGTIQVRSAQQAIARVGDLVRDYEVGVIVLGMPLNMDGTEGAQAAWVRQFGDRLASAMTGVEIVYWDERLTTVASESFLIEAGMRGRKRRQHRDKIAAAFILQSYLERRRAAPPKPSEADAPPGGEAIKDEDSGRHPA